MERFDIRGQNWGIAERQDGLGAFTWAEEALAYKRSFWSSFFVNVFMVVVCALLSAYIVYHKHDPVPVSKPVISSEQYRQAVQDQQQLQAKLDAAAVHILELNAKKAVVDVQLKSALYVVKQYEQQLKELHTSVPAQPIILEAVRKEASTPAGFNAVVARSFGNDLAGRIKVIE